MKELSIEQKAQRYDEAIERAKAYQGLRSEMEIIFPELKESEDEKIRKAIENVIRVYGKTQGEWIGGYDMDTLIIHLRKAFEKQDKQKLAWSKYDEEFLLELSQCCDLNKTQVQWLLSLKDRVQPQSHWKPSDEQIEALESATENCAYSEYQDCLKELIEQLKKLKG